MKFEHKKIITKETAIKLQASEVNAIRVKDIERNAVRVFKDGKIGISGAIGSTTVDTLKEQAVANLQSNIPYPYELEKNKKDHRDYTSKVYSEAGLLKLTEKLLTALKEEHDDFIYSETVKAIQTDSIYTNSEGLDLRYQDQHIDLGLIVKSKTSTGLFDTFLAWQGRNLNEERYIQFCKQFLNAERNKVELPKEEKIPVVFADLSTVGMFMVRHLNGETYGNKASLFNDKLGEKLFNEKFSMIQDRNPERVHMPFFDSEGVTNENDIVPLIENGVLINVFTDKKNAEKFNLKHTGSASGGYDDVPTIGFINARPLVDTKDLKKELNGKMAVLCLVAAGGEVNASGNYATPVQASYLFDGKNIIGKLPEFNMSGSIFDMFGDDYIGTFEMEDIYFGEHVEMTACYMNIK